MNILIYYSIRERKTSRPKKGLKDAQLDQMFMCDLERSRIIHWRTMTLQVQTSSRSPVMSALNQAHCHEGRELVVASRSCSLLLSDKARSRVGVCARERNWKRERQSVSACLWVSVYTKGEPKGGRESDQRHLEDPQWRTTFGDLYSMTQTGDELGRFLQFLSPSSFSIYWIPQT